MLLLPTVDCRATGDVALLRTYRPHMSLLSLDRDLRSRAADDQKLGRCQIIIETLGPG